MTTSTTPTPPTPVTPARRATTRGTGTGSSTTVLARLRTRAGGPASDDGAAMLVVIMLMLVVAALSVLVLGAVVSQVRPTAATQQSTQVVFAAETGLQTALSQIRSATTGSSGGSAVGSIRSLPCAMTGSGGATGITYTVKIDYFTTDPASTTDAWQRANALTCSTSAGVGQLPSFAVVSSTGSDGTSGAVVHSRKLQAQYAFRISNANVPGGIMYTLHGAACLQADADVVGATVHYVAGAQCARTQPLQQWVYDTGYHMVLASTITTTTTSTGATTTSTTTNGLCITQKPQGDADRVVTLQACSLDSRNPGQLWSYEGGARFRGQNDGNTDYGSNCLFGGSSGSPVGRVLQAGGPGTCDGTGEDRVSWAPEPRVGAGAASIKTHQIINYLQFGRCMDVTFENIDYNHMIIYPCKQDPSPSGEKVKWNHKWYYGAESGTVTEPAGAEGMSTRIRVLVDNDPGRTYCLTVPAGVGTTTYPVFRHCDGSADQQLTRWYDTGSYTTSYLFTTSDGRCLSLGGQSPNAAPWSTLVATACTGGPEQKWNAPPTAQDAQVTRQLETTVRRS